MRDPMQHREGSPTVEVRAYWHGNLIGRTLCESDDEAAEVVEDWTELDGVECEVDDLTFRHRPGDVFEPEPAVELSEDDQRAPGIEDGMLSRPVPRT